MMALYPYYDGWLRLTGFINKDTICGRYLAIDDGQVGIRGWREAGRSYASDQRRPGGENNHRL